jgi:hypothetical protein
MKSLFFLTVALLFGFPSILYTQAQDLPKYYVHKVMVDSVIQTKAYTYIKVRERIKETDSLQWMALPSFNPKAGDTYYHNGGLQMGEFHSKELDRTFDQIMFLPVLGTSPEVSEKNVVPAPVFDTVPVNTTPVEVHKVIVKEVIQTSGYTYLRVKEGDREEWLAVVRIPAYAGQEYTYDDAAAMKNFTSKELKRVFKEILFVSKLTLVTKDELDETSSSASTHQGNKMKPGNDQKKKEKIMKMEPVDGGITIAELYKNKNKYSGKTVRIKGEVTKYNANILGKNWIHLEDGTGFSKKSDLTITIDREIKVGDVIVAEGIISLDRDFGSNYFFEVIMENAKVELK